jgi:hypothetical protein
MPRADIFHPDFTPTRIGGRRTAGRRGGEVPREARAVVNYEQAVEPFVRNKPPERH